MSEIMKFMQELQKAEEKQIGMTMVGNFPGFTFAVSFSQDNMSWHPDGTGTGIEFEISALNGTVELDIDTLTAVADMDGFTRVWEFRNGDQTVLIFSFLEDPR